MLTHLQTIFARLPGRLREGLISSPDSHLKRDRSPPRNDAQKSRCRQALLATDDSLDDLGLHNNHITDPPLSQADFLSSHGSPAALQRHTSPRDSVTTSSIFSASNIVRFVGSKSIEDIFAVGPVTSTSGFASTSPEPADFWFSQNSDSLDQYVSGLDFEDSQAPSQAIDVGGSISDPSGYAQLGSDIHFQRFVPLSPYIMRVDPNSDTGDSVAGSYPRFAADKAYG